jgi:hypothetical protein
MEGMTDSSAAQDLRDRALEVVRAERYLVLATVSADRVPWSSPVWFAHDRLSAFYWLSRPGRTHSVNLVSQPRVAFVVFDSRQRVGTGLAVYAAADAGPVPDQELESALGLVSVRSVADGGGAWSQQRLAEAPLRLYVARPVELSLLPGEGTDERVRLPEA